jgi:hypothetical protein
VNTEQRISELEKRVADLEKKAAEATTASKTMVLSPVFKFTQHADSHMTFQELHHCITKNIQDCKQHLDQ